MITTASIMRLKAMAKRTDSKRGVKSAVSQQLKRSPGSPGGYSIRRFGYVYFRKFIIICIMTL